VLTRRPAAGWTHIGPVFGLRRRCPQIRSDSRPTYVASAPRWGLLSTPRSGFGPRPPAGPSRAGKWAETRPASSAVSAAASRGPLLQFLQRPRPVALQQPGQGAVGVDAPAGLAPGTVVGLVLRIDDPLDGCAALRAGPAVAAVDPHGRVEGRDLFREPRSRLGQLHADGLLQDLDRRDRKSVV